MIALSDAAQAAARNVLNDSAGIDRQSGVLPNSAGISVPVESRIRHQALAGGLQ